MRDDGGSYDHRERPRSGRGVTSSDRPGSPPHGARLDPDYASRHQHRTRDSAPAQRHRSRDRSRDYNRRDRPSSSRPPAESDDLIPRYRESKARSSEAKTRTARGSRSRSRDRDRGRDRDRDRGGFGSPSSSKRHRSRSRGRSRSLSPSPQPEAPRPPNRGDEDTIPPTVEILHRVATVLPTNPPPEPTTPADIRGEDLHPVPQRDLRLRGDTPDATPHATVASHLEAYHELVLHCLLTNDVVRPRIGKIRRHEWAVLL
ncbi:hypothetical protein ACHAPV_007219 [Trichoderma viride]